MTTTDRTIHPTRPPLATRVLLLDEPGYGITVNDGRHTLTCVEMGPRLDVLPGHGVSLDPPAARHLAEALTRYADRYPDQPT